MSSTPEERGINQRVPERPSLRWRAIAEVPARHMAYRFLAGALTSAAAGLVTLAFGSRAAGILLAFPAILAASLTLIEEQEDSAKAREDARGAAAGGVAMAAFAAVAGVCFATMSGAIALLLATVAWFGVAFLAYLLVWLR